MEQNFINTAIRQFQYYRSLGDKTIALLSIEQMLYEVSAGVNTVAINIQHLSGNMLSRFTEFLTTDGEKEWRNRDEEFGKKQLSKNELQRLWDKGWDCLLSTLGQLKVEDLSEEVFIRNEGHTVQEAIVRQLCHYSYHIGQIVLLGRMQLGDKWIPLSIPPGQSAAFNKEKFSSPKASRHFTEEPGDVK